MTDNEKLELNILVEAINNAVNTEEIYLFGSFATDTQKSDSDFDIYVILAKEEIRPIKAIQKINYTLSQTQLRSVDILANYRNAFLSAAKEPSLEREILEKGVKLYERHAFTS